MDQALGVSKQNCLQWRERRPSPPVAHDCRDPLELGLVERHTAVCHSITSMEQAVSFIPQDYPSRDDVLQCNKYVVGMPELSAVLLTFPYLSSKYSDMTELFRTIKLLVIPVNYHSVDVLPQATIRIDRVHFTYVSIIFNDTKPVFFNGSESSSGEGVVSPGPSD